jgi:hypothetical protein
MSLLSKLIERSNGHQNNGNHDNHRHFVEVGWLLQSSQGSFLWDAPKPFRRKDVQPTIPKSVSRCPAVIDLESRITEVLCPFDLHLGVKTSDDGSFSIVDREGVNSSIAQPALARILFPVPPNQWRNPKRPIFQIRTPYIFLADTPVYMSQLPPFLDHRMSSWPGTFIGGRIPIHIWPRVLSWAFEWHELDKDLTLRRGEAWFYCQFETQSPDQRVRLVEAALTPQLKTYLAGMEGVVNYVSRTFSIFRIAQERRPAQLVVKVQR